MITEIGIVAGEIWQILDGVESLCLKEIVAKLDRPEYLVLMSLGWLSREGHILVDKIGDEFKICLRRKQE